MPTKTESWISKQVEWQVDELVTEWECKVPSRFSTRWTVLGILIMLKPYKLRLYWVTSKNFNFFLLAHIYRRLCMCACVVKITKQYHKIEYPIDCHTSLYYSLRFSSFSPKTKRRWYISASSSSYRKLFVSDVGRKLVFLTCLFSFSLFSTWHSGLHWNVT